MSVEVHPTALVDPGAKLGSDVVIGPFCVVGPEVVLGDDVKLVSHVTIAGATELGAGCEVFPFAALGHAPQHKGYRGEPVFLKVGARTIIREHVTMHPGTPVGGGLTRVGSDGFFMVGAHVAHDCMVGDGVVFANNATLGGHVSIGDFVWMGGLCAVHQWSRIGPHAFVGGMATVTKDVIPYGSVVGNHAYLAGLNIVGLKRRGFTSEQLHDMRAAYRMLFAEEGTFQERVEDVAAQFGDRPEVREVLDFIKADSSRPLCMPH